MAYQSLTKAHPIRGLTRPQKRALAQSRRIRASRIATLMLLGGKCERCGFNDMRALQIDHVDGKGKEERRKLVASDPFYRHVMSEAHHGGYQVLCANHNWIKRAEREEHDKPITYAMLAAEGLY